MQFSNLRVTKLINEERMREEANVTPKQKIIAQTFCLIRFYWKIDSVEDAFCWKEFQSFSPSSVIFFHLNLFLGKSKELIENTST